MNIAKILENCPKGTKLYSPLFGEVEYEYIDDTKCHQIYCRSYNDDSLISFTEEGLYYRKYEDAECLLFPSKDNRDWNSFQGPQNTVNNYEIISYLNLLLEDACLFHIDTTSNPE